jgi:hypothetical protein
MSNIRYAVITLTLATGLLATLCFAGELEEVLVDGAEAARRAAAEEMGRRYAEGQALEYARQRGYESMLQAQAAAEQERLREQLRTQAEADRAKTRPERVKKCQQDAVSAYASCSNSGISAYKGHMSYCNYLLATAAASGTVAAGAVLFAGASTVPTVGTGTVAGGTVAGVAGAVAAVSGGAGAICSNMANTNLTEKQSQCDVSKAQNELNCANLQ